jgi:hypothetical protein
LALFASNLSAFASNQKSHQITIGMMVMSRLQSILGGAMLEMPQRLEPERFIFLAPADRGNTAGGCESAERPNFSPHGRGLRVLFWFRLCRLR